MFTMQQGRRLLSPQDWGANASYCASNARGCSVAPWCEIAHKLNADKGSQPDAGTRNEGMRVDCPEKRIEFLKSVALAAADLTPAWHRQKRTQHNLAACRGGFRTLLDSGWQVLLIVETSE